MSLRKSFLKDEGEMQISKSVKHPVLLNPTEMEDLFEQLGDFSIFSVGRPLGSDQLEISKAQFLKTYWRYVQRLQEGKVFDDKEFRTLFSSLITHDKEALYAMDVGEGRFLVKAIKPTIQLQMHHFIYSEVDEKFHLGVMGRKSVSWGIKFSYPGLYQHPQTKEILKTKRDSLFQLLSKWIRQHTLATPFLVKEKRINVPVRLGKECFSWINEHPGLKENNIEVMHVI